MKPFSNNEKIKAFLYLHADITSSEEAREVIAALEKERPNWQNLRNMEFERTFPQVYIKYAEACIKIGDYSKALEILGEANEQLKHSDFKYYFGEKANINDMLARCLIANNDINKAYKATLESVFNLIYASNNTHFSNFEFYGFRAVSDYSINDLKNETLSLCSPLQFNDPVDTPLFSWFHYLKEYTNLNLKGKARYNELTRLKILEKAYGNLRARCLVRNIRVPNKEGRDVAVAMDYDREYANTLMWAHYADFHKGFCVKYVFPSSLTSSDPEDSDLLMLRPINYVDTFPLHDDFGFQKSQISFLEAFFTKQKKWEYEHEHRLIYFHRNGSVDYPTPKLPKGSVKAVYLGVKISLENKQKIINALHDKPEVEIFQMQISSEDLYKLKATKITERLYKPLPADRNILQRCKSYLTNFWRNLTD